MAIAEVIKEVMYLKSFLKELKFENILQVKIFNDNQGAISLASNHQHHARTKHIDIRYHFIRDALKDGSIKLDHVRTTEMIADILTKGLPGNQHQVCLKRMGIIPGERIHGAALEGGVGLCN